MNMAGLILILLGLLGIIFFLIYKIAKKSLKLIGPKSVIVLIICGILIIIGILLLFAPVS